jgi:hypothetical protein
MPSKISNTINRPLFTDVDAAEFGANTRPIVAYNILLSYGEELWVDSIIGWIRPVDPAQLVAPFPRLVLMGMENVFLNEITVGGTIFTQRDEGKLTYYFDNFVNTLEFRISDFLDEPIKMVSYERNCFGLGLSAGGGLAAGYTISLQVNARIIKSNQKQQRFFEERA